ncbi:RadC family protein [Longimicrobium sp.]|uniref:RadC family protein n=1 Tax=Longimicrobium sp. TaxID=2029185 RepID=UPI003B3A9357
MPALAVPIESTCGVVKIKEWPATDRPRERLCTLGPQSLSSRELLALLIESGRPATDERPARSAMDLAGDLLAWALQGADEDEEEEPGKGGGRRRRDAQPLRRIMMAQASQLCGVRGIGPARAAKILAAMELGRRAVQEVRRDAPRFLSASDVFEHVHVRMRDLRHEEFHVVLLNAQGELLRMEKVAQGTIDSCHVEPREVFGPAMREGAYSVVAVHNHPSGEPRPSNEDRNLTSRLESAATLLGLRLLDHIIVGEQRYWSFAEQKQMTSGW